MANKSVYNFVPAPKENQVFKPEWAGYVSQDIPFEDAQSGEIEIELEALTPVFIRNGQRKDSNDDTFSHYVDENDNEKYFIPGTSIKGMVRNVLEILSYSKLNKKLVDNKRYSYRDLRKDSLYMRNYNSNKVFCGWLTQNDEGEWSIYDCGRPYLIEHFEIDQALRLDKDKGIEFTYCTDNENPVSTDAKSKYELLNSLDKFFEIPFSKDHPDLTKKERARNIVLFDEESDDIGHLVVTGQVGKVDYEKEKISGKYHEFLFPILEKNKKLYVSDDIQKDFRFIYKEGATDESPDWKFWRKKLDEEGKRVPVFFSKDSKGGVAHLGLAYMYKLPYKQSVHDLYPLSDYSDTLDLSEVMFGHTQKQSLKGRVSFGHAKNINNSKPIKAENIVLGSPKASFYPYYLEQYKNSKYQTYEDSSAELRGFKRYPLRKDIMPSNADPKNTNVQTSLNPLGTGAKFKGKIRFFNLKKVELGALLSALTFHNRKDCHHNLGMAKPFGYGKMNLTINHLIIDDQVQEIDSYLSEFENKMERVTNGDWKKSKSLNELFAMASNNDNENLGYMELVGFAATKKAKQYLHKFTDIKR